MRLVKHIGARACPTDDAKVLIAIPTFPGEKITNISLDGYFASGDASAIDQPGEVNFYGITIPWGLVFVSSSLQAGAAVEDLGGVPEIDKLFAQWLRSADDGLNETFGGDVDSDPDQTEGEAGHVQQALIDSGPIGVFKWFRRERIMRPMAAEGNTVIRFGDEFVADTGPIPAHGMGGLNLFGCVRFLASAQTNFNVEMDDATSREMLSLLIAGDYSRVKAKVEGDTAVTGDYLRTVLFGGDMYVEADTLKGPAGQAVVKAVASIDSILSRNPA